MTEKEAQEAKRHKRVDRLKKELWVFLCSRYWLRLY